MRKKSLAYLLSCLLIVVILPFSVFAEEEKSNLVQGMSYVIETGEPVKYSYADYAADNIEFDDNSGQLTDGNTVAWTVSSAAATSSAWYRAFRGQSRIVTFDLGESCAVSGIDAGFLHQRSSEIYAPRYINIRLSDNGVDYQLVKAYINDYPLYSDVVERCVVEISLEKIYSARYVQVEFSCDEFCYCDEISVYGTRALSGKEEKVVPDEEKTSVGYLKSLDGITDIVKLYNGDESFSEDELLPYVAYINTNGEIVGEMFDAVAFVPYGETGTAMSDWERYFDNTFAESINLSALNNVVGRVNSVLGQDKKFKVFLTVPYPAVIDNTFGDIDGDGVWENCRTLEERMAIIEWYVEKCIDEFKAKEYENLELAGFCWSREKIDYYDSDHEAELVKQMNELVEDKRFLTLFDSYYLAAGFDHWEALGFGGAVMQPNVASDTYGCFATPMLSEFAVTAYNNRLGAEIETAAPDMFSGEDYLSAGKNYESYLYYGYKQGYMYGLNTYYQGVGPGSYYDFCYADINTPKGIYLRRLYDLTYSYIRGTYKNEAPAVSIDDIELVKGDESMVANIYIEDSDSFWGDIYIEFPQKPSRGRVVAASGKNKISYTPDSDYVGEDSFTVVVNDGFNRSEEITVRVNVTEPEIPFASSEEETSSEISKTTTPIGDERPVWLIPLLGVLAFAMVAVAVATVIKKRKK